MSGTSPFSRLRTVITTALRRSRSAGGKDVIAETADPDGRRVQLTEERWEHILVEPDGHPELAGYQAEVMRAVHAPDERRPGRKSNEQWFFLRNAGPSRWLQVVVAYEGSRGWIVTAFARRRNP